MDALDLEVKIKFLEKAQDKLMDLYLDALVRITNLEKYIQSVNINYPTEQQMEYSPPKESQEPETKKDVIYKRKYLDEEPPPAGTTNTADMWDLTVSDG